MSMSVVTVTSGITCNPILQLPPMSMITVKPVYNGCHGTSIFLVIINRWLIYPGHCAQVQYNWGSGSEE